MWMKRGLIAVALLAGCGQVEVDPDQTLAQRGQSGSQVGAGGAQQVPTGAGGAPGSGGAAGAPASTWSCAVTVLAPSAPTADRPYAFMNYGGSCTRGGGECRAAAAAYDATTAPVSGTVHFAEECTADPDPAGALPGPGFCSTVTSPRSWDTSCRVIRPEQIPTGWICCTTPSAPAVLVPARCGCP